MKQILTTMGVAGLLAGGFAPAAEDAQDQFAQRDTGDLFQPAEPLELGTPDYPRSAWQDGAEGWVLLSFVIKTDGSVRDVVVEDSTGPQFEQAAVAAAREFRYRPALLNGEPVEESVPAYRITYSLEDGQKVFSQGFGRRARSIARSIERGDLARAQAALDELRERPRWNLYEDAWMAYLQALCDEAVGNLPAVRQGLLRALAYRDSYLPEDIRLDALERLYADYARTGELAMALETYGRIIALPGGARDRSALHQHAAQLRELVAGDATLRAEGIIAGKRPWVHKLARRAFEFSDAEGRLESFELRCQRQARRWDFIEEIAWDVPESWGPCQVYVFGEAGARFALWEYDAS